MAERLGRTVEELLSSISSAELTRWRAHDELTQSDRERAERMAGKGMSLR